MGKISQTLIYLLLFLVIIFFIEYVFFNDVYLEVTNETEKFNFKNFIVFNFSIKIIGYFFKFIFLFGFFKFVLVAFNIKDNVSLFESLIISEVVYLLITKGTLIIYFFFVNTKIDARFISNYETSTSLKLLFSETIANSPFKYLITSVTLFDLIYIIVLMVLLSNDLKKGFLVLFKRLGVSYILLLIFIGVVKTFMAL